MTTPGPPHQNNIAQIGYKLISMVKFEGKKRDEVAKALVSAALRNDSVESKSKAYDVSPQTVRNHAEEQGLRVAEKPLEETRKISLQILKGVKEIEISIDRTSIEYHGKPVLGLSSSEKGYSWNCATATTKYRDKTLLLAFVPQVKGMTKGEIVKALVEQVESMGSNTNLITLDAGFHTVDVIKFVLRFK
jgi:putative transposase